MNNPNCAGCNGHSCCKYFITVPGGDSLLCKPFRKERFYHIGYSSSGSCSMKAVYCNDTINNVSAIVYDELDLCTCDFAPCFFCPKVIFREPSTCSSEECNCPCTCDKPKCPNLTPDICRVTELVDGSSSVSDLLTQAKEVKKQSDTEKSKKKCKCRCRPVQSICLKSVLNKCSCGESSVSEIKSSGICRSNGEVLSCSPCKRKLKFKIPICVASGSVCPASIEKEKECLVVHQNRKCKCKDKKKKSEKKICKCNISPPIVICDRKPEKNKSFLQTIKSMISSASKTDKHRGKCACKKDAGKINSDIYSISVCSVHKNKLSSIAEQAPKSHSTVGSDKAKSRQSHSSKSKHKENLNKVEDPSKPKNSVPHSKKNHKKKDTGKPETEINQLKKKSNQSELNTIFLSNKNASTDHSIFLNAEEKTVQYVFLQTYERFPFSLTNYSVRNVTYNFELRYKSLLWISFINFNDTLKSKKPLTIDTKPKPLETSDCSTQLNNKNKYSQVTDLVGQRQDNSKDFLSIVKKFEKYKNQQRVLEEAKRRMSDSYRKRPVDNIAMRYSRKKRKVFFTKIKRDYFCRIFCDLIGPVIYFLYFVVFIWITFK